MTPPTGSTPAADVPPPDQGTRVAETRVEWGVRYDHVQARFSGEDYARRVCSKYAGCSLVRRTVTYSEWETVE